MEKFPLGRALWLLISALASATCVTLSVHELAVYHSQSRIAQASGNDIISVPKDHTYFEFSMGESFQALFFKQADK